MRLPLALQIAAAVLVTAAPVRAAVSAEAVSRAAREVVANCAATAPAKHSGLEELEQDCPGLDAALTQLGWKDLLAEGVAGHVDAGSLTGLVNATRVAAQRGPDPAQVGTVLAGLHPPVHVESRWERFRNWLQRLLKPRNSASTPWLVQWLEHLTFNKLLLNILIGALMIMIVAAALFMIVRELRAAGLRWGSPLRRTHPTAGGVAAALVADGAGDWRQFTVVQRPAALFRHVAARLAADGRLPAPRSHTHRELRYRARLDAPPERAAWSALARVAERQIYAPQGLDDAEAEQVVADAARIWDPDPQ